jgi:hypothetical protein
VAQTPKQGIPPAPAAPPTDPNAGKNIHGQPNYQPPPPQSDAQPGQVDLEGTGPRPDMASPPNAPTAFADNTRAEMDAGRANLRQYSRRDDAEHEAGRKTLQHHADRNLPKE